METELDDGERGRGGEGKYHFGSSALAANPGSMMSLLVCVSQELQALALFPH